MTFSSLMKGFSVSMPLGWTVGAISGGGRNFDTGLQAIYYHISMPHYSNHYNVVKQNSHHYQKSFGVEHVPHHLD